MAKFSDNSILNRSEMEVPIYLPERRFFIPCCNSSSPTGLIRADAEDPWQRSGKYALGWVYFCAAVLIIASFARLYNVWIDGRSVTARMSTRKSTKKTASPQTDHELSAVESGTSTRKFFPQDGTLPSQPVSRSTAAAWPICAMVGLSRSILYRPMCNVHVQRERSRLAFPSVGALLVVTAAITFVLCYCFIPQPLFFESIAYGSPPLAIRGGMIAIAMIPWFVALGMKANIVSYITGIEHTQLIALHRWAVRICLLVSLLHMVPFYVARIREPDGYAAFHSYFAQEHVHIMGTGIAAFVPLATLFIISLPPIRNRFYESLALIYTPGTIVLAGMLFWHCNNYLSSWSYLFATAAIFGLSHTIRLCRMNWTNPFSKSWLVGDEAAVTLLPERAAKIMVQTKKKWEAGQHIYLRMPGVAVLESHPFTIVSQCGNHEPSALGKDFHTLTLVFRPRNGFTNKVVETALNFGQWHTYRAFLDGPYGGMQEKIEAFDHVIFVAGGIGVASVIPNLVHIIERMRDRTSTTRTVHLVWVMKRAESIEWFEDELQRCHEIAPAGTLRCDFFVTSAEPEPTADELVSAQISMPASGSGLSHDDLTAAHTLTIEELKGDDHNHLEPPPPAHLRPLGHAIPNTPEAPAPPDVPTQPTLHEKRRARGLTLNINPTAPATSQHTPRPPATVSNPQQFDFGFPSTPSDIQKNLMHLAFAPAVGRPRSDGWNSRQGRPNVAQILETLSQEWVGRRVCVFASGPSSMRVDASNAVADLQTMVWRGEMDEVYLHTENYVL